MARRPVNAPYSISGSFGEYYGAAAKFLYHSGVDYALPTGREVYAPIGGTVTAYTWAQFHGNVVQIKGDDGLHHRLMHNSQLLVSPGQRVNEGQLVAKSGATGDGVTGPHVHWDICIKAVPLAFSDFRDPAKWLNGEYQVSQPTQGDKPMSPQEETEAYQIVLQRNPDGAATGRTGISFMRDARGELAVQRRADTELHNTLNQKVTEMQNIVNNLSARPTKDQYALAQAQLNDRLVELQKAQAALEAEKLNQPDEKQVVTNWFKKQWERLFK